MASLLAENNIPPINTLRNSNYEIIQFSAQDPPSNPCGGGNGGGGDPG